MQQMICRFEPDDSSVHSPIATIYRCVSKILRFDMVISQWESLEKQKIILQFKDITNLYCVKYILLRQRYYCVIDVLRSKFGDLVL